MDVRKKVIAESIKIETRHVTAYKKETIVRTSDVEYWKQQLQISSRSER